MDRITPERASHIASDPPLSEDPGGLPDTNPNRATGGRRGLVLLYPSAVRTCQLISWRIVTLRCYSLNLCDEVLHTR